MLTRRFAAVRGCTRRTLPSLLLVALLLSPFGQPAPAAATQPLPPRPEVGPVQGEPAPEPAALLQVDIKSLYIRDDRDRSLLGSGDFRLQVGFWRCTGAPAEPCSAGPDNPAVLIARWDHSFDADSQSTVALDRVIPLAADVRDSASATEELGIAVYAGQRYLLDIGMVERDGEEDDLMGGVQTDVAESNGWGIAAYPAVTSYRVAESLPYPGGALCAGWFCGGDFHAGDYDVTYEIRATPFPDLTPTDIHLIGQPGPGAQVCVRVDNVGQSQAALFELNLRLDGVLLPTGYTTGANLAAGGSTEPCAKVDLPTVGIHTLQATIDESQALRESDESNNQLEQTFVFGRALDHTGLRPDVGPLGVAPEPDRPDLIASEIRVRGESPNGANDCDPGQNRVTVVVANPDSIGGFAVRLVVDNRDNQAYEIMVGPVESGARILLQFYIPFDDVKLTRGDHTLTAFVDSRNAVAESDEGNNSVSLVVSCRDE